MQRLTLLVQGPGRINVDPINGRCESACQFDVPTGTRLSLSAIPAEGPVEGATRFMGWSQACSGQAGCDVTMDGARTATAQFHRLIVWEQRAPVGAMGLRGDDLYLTGRFVSGQSIAGQAPFSHGLEDGFLARYAIDGSLRWVKTLGGPMNDHFWRMSLATSGDILLSGSAGSDDVRYDGTPLGVAGNFRAAFNADGKLSSVTVSPFLTGIAIDSSGNLLTLEDQGTGTDRSTALVKRDPAGRVLWTKPGMGRSAFFAGPLVDAADNVIAAYGINDPITLVGRSFRPEDGCCLLVKLSAAGDYLWAVQTGPAPGLGLEAIRLDQTGDVYLTLNFTGRLGFGRPDVSTDGGADVAFVRIGGARGDVVWSRTFATFLPDVVGGVAFDGQGRLVAMVSFLTSVTVGAQSFPRGELAIRFNPTNGEVLSAIDIGRNIASMTRHASGDFIYRRYQLPEGFVGRLSLP